MKNLKMEHFGRARDRVMDRDMLFFVSLGPFSAETKSRKMHASPLTVLSAAELYVLPSY
jgi:hypothetical protein